MILSYYKGNNFGDAINPIIFNHFLPDFFDQNNSDLFLGIGSVLGFLKPEHDTQKALVFSSGFAYNEPPVLDERYDVRCVRGPLTAKALKLPAHKGVADGALLLTELPHFKTEQKKKYPFSFIPHHSSERLYDRYDELLGPLGIKYISPAQDPYKVIQEIRQSEVVLAEAMHAAITADAFRVPWIPIKMFQHINSFKWQDWLLSMEIREYKPHLLNRLYNDIWIAKIIENKTSLKETNAVNAIMGKGYKKIQNNFLEDKVRKQFLNIMKHAGMLSKEGLVGSKSEQLQEILRKIKKDYRKKQ